MRSQTSCQRCSLRRRFVPGLVVFLCLLAATLLPTISWADSKVALKVDKHIARVNERVQVKVTVTAEGSNGYEEFIPPKADGFRVGRGGMTSRNIEMINWKVRRHETFVYNLFPQRAGKLTVGPAAIRVGGRSIESQTVTVHVREGAAPADANDEPEAEQDSAAASRPGDADEDEGIFIAARARPQQVYVGQQVTAEWSLYTQHDILGYQSEKRPAAASFWAEDLESPRRLNFRREQVDGETFYVALLERKAYFPQRAGEVTITPLGAQLRVMASFSTAQVRRASEPLTVKVLPLPQEGRPSGFAEENVGMFQIAASLDRTAVNAGDAVTLKLIISGQGNLRQVKAPVLTRIPGFKVYEPRVTDQLEMRGTIRGEKVVEYLLLPTKSGTLQIPPVTLNYFDPQGAVYRQEKTQPLIVTVEGKMPRQGASPTIGALSSENVLGPDIRPPRPAAELQDVTPFRLFTAGNLALLGLPLFALLLLDLGGRARRVMGRPTARSLSRAAAKRVQQHLAQAQTMRQTDPAAFYAQLSAALQGQLRHQTGLVVEGMTRSELRGALLATDFDAELADQICDELDRFDQYRFAPSGEDAQVRTEAFDRVQRLVGLIAQKKRSSATGQSA